MKRGTADMKTIARIRNDFPTKFGIPHQSGCIEELKARIIFEAEYRNEAALRGIEEFSHIWLIWEFSDTVRDKWSPTVRPPRRGGNQRVGVFATRSPFRPNPIGLSSVRLEYVEWNTAEGPVLHICGADLMDGTPIYDIKPYIPHDIHVDASSGFIGRKEMPKLRVKIDKEMILLIPPEKRTALLKLLEADPRPRYHHDPDRVYGMPFSGYDIHFRVDGEELAVCDIEKL